MTASWVGIMQLPLNRIYVQEVLEMYEYEIRNGASKENVLEENRFGKDMVGYVRDEPGLRNGFRVVNLKRRKSLKLDLEKNAGRNRYVSNDSICIGEIVKTRRSF